MAIREGCWDCPACGRTGNPGRSLDCYGCGKSRPHGVRFYLPFDAREVTDANQLREAQAGPDWICRWCATSNRAELPICRRCKSQRNADSLTQHVDRPGDRPRATPREIPRRTPGDDAPRHALDVPGHAPGRTYPRALDGRGWLRRLTIALSVLGGLAGLVLALAAYGRWNMHRERLAPGVIVETRWKRSIPVDGPVPYTDAGWELPDGAVVIATEQRLLRHDTVVDRYEQVVRTRERAGERRQAGTEQYVCGQRDRGNGYFEDEYCTRPRYETAYYTEHDTTRVPVYRTVPVYAPWYRYTTHGWARVARVDTSGVNTAPAWPVLTLAPGQREGWREREHTARVRDREGRVHEALITHEDSLRFRVGDRVAFGQPSGAFHVGVYPPDSLRACRRWHQGRARRPPPAELGCSPLPAERLPR